MTKPVMEEPVWDKSRHSPPSDTGSPSPVHRTLNYQQRKQSISERSIKNDDFSISRHRRTQSLKNPTRPRTKIIRLNNSKEGSPQSPLSPKHATDVHQKEISRLRRTSMTGSVPNLNLVPAVMVQIERLNIGKPSRKSRRTSVDRKSLPEGSQTYLEALRQVSTSSEELAEDTNTKSELEATDSVLNSEKGDLLNSSPIKPGYMSKTAEEICLRNFKSPYPKYMEAMGLHSSSLQLEPLELPEPSSAPNSPPLSPHGSERSFLSRPERKAVSWGGGEVFTFDKLPPVNGSWDNSYQKAVLGKLGKVEEDAGEAEYQLNSPPRLRRARSAKSRPKPSLIELTKKNGRKPQARISAW